MAELGQAASGPLTWGVAALLLATGDALAARFGAVAVRGELAGFSRAASGHCYFSLKDIDGAPALLRCVMFRRAAGLVGFTPADGQQVELRGRLGVYDARGELQMVVESLARLGAGTLYEEFLRRRARLEAAGLFDPARKRALPAFPTALGVVTSLAAAALHDVLASLRRRAPQVRVVLYPCAVQGAAAPLEICAALERAGQRREVELLLLVRGGGSLEDLWAFNDERVVRAVANCALPVVCGVGHETDLSLCDLAADLRAPTPTAAAELAAPARDEALRALQARQAALLRSVERLQQTHAQRLDGLGLRLGQPARVLLGEVARLRDRALRLRLAAQLALERLAAALPPLADRLGRGFAGSRREQGLRLDRAEQRLQSQDPHRVLRRGYAWVEAEDGRPIVSARGLMPDQILRAVWADGAARALVTAVESLPPGDPGGLPTIPPAAPDPH